MTEIEITTTREERKKRKQHLNQKIGNIQEGPKLLLIS